MNDSPHLDYQQFFEDNRSNWDDRAAVHQASGYGIAELIDDPQAITPELLLDLHRFGDLTNKNIIHLQCHLGTDTIGFARQGARRTVGIDLSSESLNRARAIARECNANIEFIESNVYDARTAVDGSFDLVYTSLGVLCWLPDVNAWAEVISSLLKPGGTFFIRDDHPMLMAIGEDTIHGLVIEQPYFQHITPITWDDDQSYVTPPADAPPITHTRNHQWNHALSEIITALLKAGLILDSFEETTYASWCPWPDLMELDEKHGYYFKDHPERLPLQFVIQAHKPQ
ncbi:MAG: class I SAM-dependent methyltransferase [Actinomycetaceae bacterium]|nr:class I SAM-dependent methyltransferase [Actinomycetaceae bacterium]